MSEAIRKRWKAGGYDHEIRIRVQCAKDESHAKILRFDGRRWTFDALCAVAAVLVGKDPSYILKPGPSSPIGRCAVCGGDLESSVEEVVSNAQHQKPVDQHIEHSR